LLRLNPKGRGDVSLKEKWSTRFDTYLGMAIADFPNLFLIHGPGSPSVQYNMPLGAIEPTPEAEQSWDREVTELANATLYPHTDSWYTGANIPDKPRQFCVPLGEPLYFQRLAEVAARGYKGFVCEEERRAEVAAAL
jgi:cyclohexanone monooxygenase